GPVLDGPWELPPGGDDPEPDGLEPDDALPDG
ncbi:MAG: DUF2155 domain-containing protein, partial [Betaproteobacteria bacterium]|nr:DUF2155 domain-containing protein [Betaproteobacteria bacterium]